MRRPMLCSYRRCKVSTFNQDQPAGGRLALLPCPFCGSEPITDHIEPHKHHIAKLPDYPGSHSIECVKCEFRIFSHESLYDASKKWNTRVPVTDESHSGGNPGEKSEGLHSDHRGIPQARSSEGGNVGKSPGVMIQSREPVDSNTVSVGRLSSEPRYATDVDAAPSSRMPSDTDGGGHG